MSDLICPHCRGDAETDILTEALGRHGNARVRISGLSILRCTYCQKSAPRYSEFISDLTRVLVHTCSLPPARMVGLFRKSPGCCQCKTRLEGAETGPANFDAELELVEPPFHVDLSVLATTCAQCDTEQLVLQDSSLEEDIEQAVIRALATVAVTTPVGNPLY